MRVIPLALVWLLAAGGAHADTAASPLDQACAANAADDETDKAFMPLHALRLAATLGQAVSRPMTLVTETANGKTVTAERILPDRTSRKLTLPNAVDLDVYGVTTLRLVGTPAHLAGQPKPTQEAAATLTEAWELDQLDLEQVSDGTDKATMSQVNIFIPPEATAYGPLWPMAFSTFAVVACPRKGHSEPARAYILMQSVSNYVWATIDTAVLAALIWIGSAAAVQSAARRNDRQPARRAGGGGAFKRWLRSLDPVVITQDGLGFGSTSRLQVFFFTMVLVTTLTYVFLRAGYLAEIPSDILPLLGIGAVSGVLAGIISNARASVQEDVTWRTDRWLRRHGIIFPPRIAHWRDLVMTGQEFDVYKFQGIVFSALVGSWILSSGLSNLNTLSIPQNITVLLGLSQAVYIGGKAVGSSNDGRRELNLVVARAMRSEQALWAIVSLSDPFRSEAQARGLLFGTGQAPPAAAAPCPPDAADAYAAFKRDAQAAMALSNQMLDGRNTVAVEPVDPPDDTAVADAPDSAAAGAVQPRPA